MTLPVAIDAMGGDKAPSEIVAGARQAMEEGLCVVLVGQPDAIGDVGDIPVIEATEVIAMDDEPGKAVRTKKDSSLVRAMELVRDGEACAAFSAGNTGAGLAMVAAVRGYRCIFAVPDTMSSEKMDLLRAFGAEVIVTPTAVPPDSPESYNNVADRVALETPGAWRAGQFTNPANPAIHQATTGPEIWRDSGGRIDPFVAGGGPGGREAGMLHSF